MFLPVFGDLDANLTINFATIVIFLAVYIWHVKRDHKNNDELLKEVKKLRKDIRDRIKARK